jgi:hypothetical protein
MKKVPCNFISDSDLHIDLSVTFPPIMSVETKESVDMVESTSEPRNISAGEKGIPAETAVDNLAEVGKPPNPWGKGAKKLYMMCLLVYLCSTMNGLWPLFSLLNDITESH